MEVTEILIIVTKDNNNGRFKNKCKIRGGQKWKNCHQDPNN